jgi:hypothetical protein
MAIQRPSLRLHRVSQIKWYRSKPIQRIVFVVVILATLFLFFRSPTLLQDVILRPDRLQSISTVEEASRSDLANALNPRRSPKPRAAFVTLIRERQLSEILPVIRDIQYTFNDEHGYSYVFLSETEFTPWFKDHINDYLSKMPLKPKASFGLVSSEDWNVPSHIDLEKAKKRWARHMSAGIPYSHSTTYRQMCR